MELNILIAAPGERACQAIKKNLSQVIYQTDLERVSFLLCHVLQAAPPIDPSLWAGLHLAFVDLAFPGCGTIGQMLYKNNPSCRLVYCGRGEPELIPLLPSRPVRYWDIEGSCSLQDLFLEQLAALCSDPGFFYHSDRFRSFAVPFGNILCFYSQKRAVYIHTAEGEVGPIPKSLDYVETLLPQGRFLRVHQSFLVNRNHLRILNRGTRILTLDDGYEVPVSRALYSQTAAAFCQNNTVGSQNDVIHDLRPMNGLYSGQEEGIK